MSEVQSPFGLRKVRVAPPPSAASSSSGVYEPPPPPPPATEMGGQRRMGVRPQAGAVPADTTTNSSPFGARLIRGGGGGGGPPVPISSTPSTAPPPPTTSSSPFGPTLRSATQQQQAARGGAPMGAAVDNAETGNKQAEDGVRTSTGRHVPLIYFERIEGCLLQRAALRVFHRRRALSALTVIQDEVRAYLQNAGTSPEERATKRRLRHQQHMQLQERARELALEARAQGAKLAQDEANAWALLRRSATVLQLRSVVTVEASRRAQLEEEEQAVYVQVFLCPNPDIPACLRPGIEKEEWSMRNHIVQYERYDALKCAARAVAERAAVMILDEQRERRQLHNDESNVRVHHLREARADYWMSCLHEEEALAHRFRQVTVSQRDRFMSLMTREWAAIAALDLVEDTGPFSEVGHRDAIAQKEAFYRNRLASEFVERREFLAFAGCQKSEFSKRRGPKGIEAQERVERQVIHLAMIRGALMRMQGVVQQQPSHLLPASTAAAVTTATYGGTLCDPNTEPGNRMSIEIEEARARRMVERFLDKEAIQVFLPPMEARQRQHIVRQESRDLHAIIEAVGVVPLLFCLQEEPTARRRVLAAQQRTMVDCIFYWASLQLIGTELRSRAHLVQQQSVFEDRLLAMHYLGRVEVTERRLLRKALKSLHRRARQTAAAYSTVRSFGSMHDGAPSQESRTLEWDGSLSPPPRRRSPSAASRFPSPPPVPHDATDAPGAAGGSDVLRGSSDASAGAMPTTTRLLRTDDADEKERLYRGTPYYQRMVLLPRDHRAAVSYAPPRNSVDALMQQHQRRRDSTLVGSETNSARGGETTPDRRFSLSPHATPPARASATATDQSAAPPIAREPQSLSPAARCPLPPPDVALDTDEFLDGTTWAERIVGATASSPRGHQQSKPASFRDHSRYAYADGVREPHHHSFSARRHDDDEQAPPSIPGVGSVSNSSSGRRGVKPSHANGYLDKLLVSSPSLKRYLSADQSRGDDVDADRRRHVNSRASTSLAQQRTTSRSGGNASPSPSPGSGTTSRRHTHHAPQRGAHGILRYGSALDDYSDEERLFIVPAERVL